MAVSDRLAAMAAGEAFRRASPELRDRDVRRHADPGQGQDAGGDAQVPLGEHRANAMKLT